MFYLIVCLPPQDQDPNLQRFWDILDATWGQHLAAASQPATPPSLAIEDSKASGILAIEDGDSNTADFKGSLDETPEPVGPKDDPYFDWTTDSSDMSSPVPPQQVSSEVTSVESVAKTRPMASPSSPHHDVPDLQAAARLERLQLLRRWLCGLRAGCCCMLQVFLDYLFFELLNPRMIFIVYVSVYVSVTIPGRRWH